MERFFVWLRNAIHWHERLMARYLERRNWVVFYLEPVNRICVPDGVCWLKLYNEEIKRNHDKK